LVFLINVTVYYSHEKVPDTYSSPNIIQLIKARELSCVRYAGHKREQRNTYWSLVVKPEGKSPVRKPRCRWNITSKYILKKEKEGRRLD